MCTRCPVPTPGASSKHDTKEKPPTRDGRPDREENLPGANLPKKRRRVHVRAWFAGVLRPKTASLLECGEEIPSELAREVRQTLSNHLALNQGQWTPWGADGSVELSTGTSLASIPKDSAGKRLALMNNEMRLVVPSLHSRPIVIWRAAP